MKDRFGRAIDYLRVSVTDRCNMRCHYCYPRDSESRSRVARPLSVDEFTTVVSTAVDLGLRKVRLTGGEPLVHPDIVTLVKQLAALHGLSDLSLTTNGLLLRRLAAPLAAAGLRRVNVHLDTLNEVRYAEITGGGNLGEILAGVEAARAAGIVPIKLNCVITSSSDEPDAESVTEYAHRHGHQVRYIRRMSLESGIFSVVQGGSGGDCPRCNRLRLTSDGWIRSCLFSDLAFDVRQLGAQAAIERAIALKPRAGTSCHTRRFHMIGG
jgi:GTP 3',8-cyclase